MPAKTWLCEFATSVIANEKKERDAKDMQCYDEWQAAQSKADANPDDYEAGVLAVLMYDRMCAQKQLNDIEMQEMVAETREYLVRL